MYLDFILSHYVLKYFRRHASFLFPDKSLILCVNQGLLFFFRLLLSTSRFRSTSLDVSVMFSKFLPLCHFPHILLLNTLCASRFSCDFFVESSEIYSMLNISINLPGGFRCFCNDNVHAIIQCGGLILCWLMLVL